MRRIKILLIGNMTYDEIHYVDRDLLYHRVGGGVLHSSSVFAKNPKVDVTVATNLTTHQYMLLKYDIGVGNIIGQHTGDVPLFKLIYSGDERRLKLGSPGTIIVDTVIPNETWDTAILEPVYHEVTYSLVKRVRRLAKVVALDLQGLVRFKREDGSIVLSKNELSYDIVAESDIIHATYEELNAFTGYEDFYKSMNKVARLYSDKIWLITKGDNLIWMIHEGKIIPYDPPKIEPVDETGAGDVLLSAFTIKYVETLDPYEALEYAKKVVAFKIMNPMKPFIE